MCININNIFLKSDYIFKIFKIVRRMALFHIFDLIEDSRIFITAFGINQLFSWRIWRKRNLTQICRWKGKDSADPQKGTQGPLQASSDHRLRTAVSWSGKWKNRQTSGFEYDCVLTTIMLLMRNLFLLPASDLSPHSHHYNTNIGTSHLLTIFQEFLPTVKLALWYVPVESKRA